MCLNEPDRKYILSTLFSCEEIFKKFKINIKFLTGKTDLKQRKVILKDLSEGKIDLLVGTHALFQKKFIFLKLGLLSLMNNINLELNNVLILQKRWQNCDVLLMSATPIPRTMMMSLYGDMDISKITESRLIEK